MPSRALWLISGSGLIPFLVCLTVAYALPGRRDAAITVFVAYAGLTLTFLGGARWGAELVRAPDRPVLARLVASALPSIVALGALLPDMPPRVALALLLACSAAQLAWDVRDARRGLLPPWNARLRIVMTALGTLCMLALLPALL